MRAFSPEAWLSRRAPSKNCSGRTTSGANRSARLSGVRSPRGGSVSTCSRASTSIAAVSLDVFAIDPSR